MTVRIRVPTGVIQGALLVPEAAVGADQLGRYLLTSMPKIKVERRDVTWAERSARCKWSSRDWIPTTG
jgi:membrane fusion protein, multidrug efflux system